MSDRVIRTGHLMQTLLYIMYIIGAVWHELSWPAERPCPVTAIMSFDSHHVVSHVVVTAILSFDLAGRAPGLVTGDSLGEVPGGPYLCSQRVMSVFGVSYGISMSGRTQLVCDPGSDGCCRASSPGGDAV
jgi:hypothetical protein